MRGAPSPGEDPDAAATAQVRGIRELLGRLAASVASALDTRVQLAALEFAEERERARERLSLLLLAAIAAGFALLAANALFVVLLWERLGWVSLALLTALWSAVTALAVWRLGIASRRAQRPFAATLAEFERDRAFLGERFGAGRR